MSMRTEGLALEQAPPLAIPLSFFLTAPFAAAGVGGALVWVGSDALLSSWSPVTLGITHLGTLGFLTMVMMGALYQMTPVVAGSPVRTVRLAHAVHACFLVGLGSLAWGLSRNASAWVFLAIAAIFVALVLFLLPVGAALLRSPVRSGTVAGMRIALAALLVTAALGVWMAHGHGGMRFPGPRALWIQVHMSVGLLGWIGGLITAVSWQVLPMFYLSEPPARGVERTTRSLVAAGVLLPVLALALDLLGVWKGDVSLPARLAAAGATPAAAAVWVLHPFVSLRALARRRRRRADPSLLFWRVGLATAPLTAVAALAASLLPAPRWGLLLGWLALWGWAGMIVHGMLYRIVPFLVWFHRFAPLVGYEAVPSARGLLPDRWAQIGFALHLTSVAVGALAILTGSSAFARLTGLLLIATAASLLGSLLHVALRRSARRERMA